MSTGLECYFVAADETTWYYVLQDGSCPVNAFSWRDYATAYGPFTSLDAAKDHLSAHHANPGGYSVHTDGLDTVDERLIAEAIR